MAVNLDGRQDGSGAGFMDKFFEEVNNFTIYDKKKIDEFFKNQNIPFPIKLKMYLLHI